MSELETISSIGNFQGETSYLCLRDSVDVLSGYYSKINLSCCVMVCACVFVDMMSEQGMLVEVRRQVVASCLSFKVGGYNSGCQACPAEPSPWSLALALTPVVFSLGEKYVIPL